MIHLILGPMFSGKTTSARQLALSRQNKHKVIYLDSVINIRPWEPIPNVPYYPLQSLKDLEKDVDLNKVDYIIIDEGQFFPEIGLVAPEWALKYTHLEIYIYALIGNYKGQLFSSIGGLIPHVDELRNLQGECWSCRDCKDFRDPRECRELGEEVNSKGPLRTVYSFRKTPDKEEILIGGESIYDAMCRKCYNRHMKKMQERGKEI